MSEQGHGAVDYEREDVNARKILIFTFSLTGIIALLIVFLVELFVFSKEEQMLAVFLKPESMQLRDLRAQDQQVLTSYKILDPAKGIYQIPIDQAMKLMVDESYQKTQANRR